MEVQNIPNLDKSKVYCYVCFKEDKENELKLNNDYYEKCNVGHNMKFTYRYNNKLETWGCYCGTSLNALSVSERQKSAIKTQIENGTLNFLNPDIQNQTGISLSKHIESIGSENWGLGKKEIHQKTIDGQIKNKTFNMMNKEVVLKMHKRFKEMKIGIYSVKNQELLKSKDFHIKIAKTQLKNRVAIYSKESIKNSHSIENNKNRLKIAIENGNMVVGLSFLIKENPLCEKHKNEEFKYYDKTVKSYICWNCFKEKWIKNQFDLSNDLNGGFINKIKIKYKDSFIQTTFRDQDSVDWKGVKFAFEQSLIDKNVAWFTYIKFYINKENNIYPLVVGKTGSKFVNDYGTDLNFSEYLDDGINNGTGRKFLKEMNFQWCKTYILVIPCNSEKEALEIEREIVKKYSLFES